MKKILNIPWPVWVCAVFVFVFSALFSYIVLDHLPHTHDEIAYLFQAKIFKLGKLYVPSPCAKESFDFSHMVNNGKWYSQYPPIHPFLLMLGLFLGIPWLVNPFFAGASIILIFLFGKEIYNKKIGITAALLGALSMWFLVTSSTMLSHTSCMFFVLLFLLFLFRSIKNPSFLNGFLAGIGLGGALLNRPYNSALIAFPFLIYFLIKFFKSFRTRFKNTLVFGLTVMLFISALLFYNFETNGDPFSLGYTSSHGKEHGLGFGKSGYLDFKHTPLLGAKNLLDNYSEMNKYLFGWPISSFLAIFPLFCISLRRKDFIKKDVLLFSGFISLSLGLFLYWGAYPSFVARMFFEYIPIFLILSAEGVLLFPKIINSKLSKINQKKAQKFTALILTIFFVYAFIFRLPAWIWPKDTDWFYHGMSNNFAVVNSDIHKAFKEKLPDCSLVIIKFLYFPFKYFPNGWWNTGFLYNDPLLKNDIIYAQDKEQKNQELFKCYPNRNIFLYFGTIQKAIVVPLFKNKDSLSKGKPIQLNDDSKLQFQFINNPLDFYYLYSEDFKKFLIQIYSHKDVVDVNVEYFYNSGLKSFKKRNYKEASFYFEAGLQIEKHPGRRRELLDKLASCYLKIGKSKYANIILKELVDVKDKKNFNIIPERGF